VPRVCNKPDFRPWTLVAATLLTDWGQITNLVIGIVWYNLASQFRCAFWAAVPTVIPLLLPAVRELTQPGAKT
jgi:hypothetical protein